jgi:hypothetical protein
MEKIKKVIKLEDLPQDGIKALYKKYPEGWKDYVSKITKPSGDFFYALNVDTDTISYLVKVPVKVDAKGDLERLEDEFADKNAEKEAENDSSLDDDASGMDDDD